MQETLTSDEVLKLVKNKKLCAKKVGGRYGKRHERGDMNKTEAEYASILQAQLLAGEIFDWSFESISLVIADPNGRPASYRPDFMITHCDGMIEFVDVKGSGPVNEASIVRIKVAAEKYWQWQFSVLKKQSKEHGGSWVRTKY